MKEQFDAIGSVPVEKESATEKSVVDFGYDDEAKTCIIYFSEDNYIQLHSVILSEPTLELSILTGIDTTTNEKIEVQLIEIGGKLSVQKIVKIIFDTISH